MLYVVYNQDTDIDEVRTESLLEAVQQATEIYDKTYDQRKNQHDDRNYTVQIIDMDEDGYQANSWDVIKDHICSNSSLYQFITTYGVNDIMDAIKDKKSDLVNKEVYHNLDEEEQLEVLKFVPDGMLLSELSRRMFEYRKYSDAISELGEELKIYV